MIGMALSAAYERLGDERCAKMALEAFSRVRHAYDEKLQGWSDSRETLKWLAGRGPHAAGIALAADAALEKLGAFPGADALEALRELALDSLLNERELFHSDALDEGNALTALCLTRMGNAEQAGKTLEAMRLRAVRLGDYTVTDPGIRSFFDPSLSLGTLGVGYVAIAWLDASEKERKTQ